VKYVLDTSVIIKGLIKPRRKKADNIRIEQFKAYATASSIIDDVYSGAIDLYIPVVAVIEIAAVASRLTGSKAVGISTARFAEDLAVQIIDEKIMLAECIDVAAQTKASGFDSVFIACAKTLGLPLITDDKGMYDAAIRMGVKAELLRDMHGKGV
jgi:predicted nucleic acid-binding protein